MISHKELSLSDRMSEPLGNHLDAYVCSLEAKESSPKHLRNVKRAILRVAEDCEFKSLRDLDSSKMEKWLALRSSEGMGARTRNLHILPWRSFLGWCRRTGRLERDPFEWVARANEAADPRRKPRALTEEECRRLLMAARMRPLHEARVIRKGPRKGRLLARVSDAGCQERTRGRIPVQAGVAAPGRRVVVGAGATISETVGGADL